MDGVLGRNQESEFREDLEVTWRELLTQEGQSRRLHVGSLELSNLPQNFCISARAFLIPFEQNVIDRSRTDIIDCNRNQIEHIWMVLLYTHVPKVQVHVMYYVVSTVLVVVCLLV